MLRTIDATVRKLTMRQEINSFEGLKGQMLKSAIVRRGDPDDYTDSDKVIFELTDGRKFLLYHQHDGSESVNIDEIEGTIDADCLVDLVGEVLQAEETSNKDPHTEDASSKDSNAPLSATFTFYRIATGNGLVVIRWYGASNGYYTESVDFEPMSTSGNQ